MEPTTSKERLLLVAADLPPAGPLATWLRHLPYLSNLAERGARARIKAPANGLAAWPSLVTGTPQHTESWDESAAFWRLLTDKGRRVVVCDAAKDETQALAGQSDWDFMLLRYHDAAAPEPGADALHRWQDWDKAIAAVGMAAGSHTAVIALALPPAAGEGTVVAGGGFIAKIGDMGTINLLDLAPTITWLLDVAPTSQMTGRVWDELWQPEAGWSEEEQQALFQHLKGLGYLS
ncbi:MAG: hypothetical protein NT169_25870 [Chloroflexi bacterium]|nr:hypothetical protein [Chloroflexota bacterium]